MTLAQPTPPVPLIIDTDTAQDDCVAIIAAMMDDAADLRAITMVAGNVGSGIFQFLPLVLIARPLRHRCACARPHT